MSDLIDSQDIMKIIQDRKEYLEKMRSAIFIDCQYSEHHIHHIFDSGLSIVLKELELLLEAIEDLPNNIGNDEEESE